jgi:hypothetical protein
MHYRNVAYVFIHICLLLVYAQNKTRNFHVNHNSQVKSFMEEWAKHVRYPFVTKRGHPYATVHREFDGMMKYLSAVTYAEDLPLDFILIGACDGRFDNVIAKYSEMQHWRGVFVEADITNYNNLKNLLNERGIKEDRAFTLHGAVSDECDENGQITFYVPKGTDKNLDFVALQMGTVRKDLIDRNMEQKMFSIETAESVTVPCYHPLQVTEKAKTYYSTMTYNISRDTSVFFEFRPMLVKVDTEGHDDRVIHGFLSSLNKIHNSSASVVDVEDDEECYFDPLLFFWERDKLSPDKNKALKSAFRMAGYAQHDEVVEGTWTGRDHSAILVPTSPLAASKKDADQVQGRKEGSQSKYWRHCSSKKIRSSKTTFLRHELAR